MRSNAIICIPFVFCKDGFQECRNNFCSEALRILLYNVCDDESKYCLIKFLDWKYLPQILTTPYQF